MAKQVNTGTEAPHGGHAKVFPPLDPQFYPSQLAWLTLTFVVLYMLLSRLALPRIGEVLAERQARIRRDLDEAERLKRATEKALKGYEQAIADARGQASTTARTMRDKLAAETEREKTSVETALAAKIADAETRIAATKTKAMQSVSEIAADTAGAVVGALTGQTATPDEIKKALATAGK
ncbi:MAG: F0F1 ATP synthase subunit B' [Hyphomicrobium sp.]